MPEVLIIAGPNGAGKTTFARNYLPIYKPGVRFLNADIIAAELCPENPDSVAIESGRRMLDELDGCVARQEEFAFETTLSGRAWIRRIELWRAAGYMVILFFLTLDSAELAKKRVSHRVRASGHSIPPKVIERRFDAGFENFHAIYKGIVDDWYLYENSVETKLLRSKSDESDSGEH